MPDPLVSVCIPTYNAGPRLLPTLRSALDQTFGDFEIVVSDDGSTDSTLTEVAHFDDSRIRVLPDSERLGAARNWNRAVAAARGRYVKVLCQDDLIYPTCLQRQVEILDDLSSADVVLVTARRDLVDNDGRVIAHARGLKRPVGRLTGPEAARIVVRSGTNPFGEPSIGLFRRDAGLACGGFDATEQYMIDVDFWMRLARSGDLVHIAEPLGAFRVSIQSWSGRLGADQARQARRFLHHLAAENPTNIGRPDIALGLTRATALGWARRGLYRWQRLRAARHRNPLGNIRPRN